MKYQSIIFAVLFAAVACSKSDDKPNAGAGGPDPSSPTGGAGRATRTPQVFRGLEMAVTSVDHSKSWAMPFGDGSAPWPAEMGEQPVLTAPQGHELIVIRIATGNGAGVNLDNIRSLDERGTEYRCAIERMSALASSQFELPFDVPVGTQLTSLRLDDVAFELAGVPALGRPLGLPGK